jgi:hypothetical protein
MLLSLSAFVRTLSVTLTAAVGGALYDRAVMIGGTQRRTTNEGQEGHEALLFRLLVPATDLFSLRMHSASTNSHPRFGPRLQ